MTSPATRKRTAVVLLLVALVVGVTAAVSQIWTRLEVIDYGYKLSRVNQEHTRLQEINRRLRIEYALLKNPSHVSRLAREKLGMKPLAPEQVRRLRGSGRPAPRQQVAVRHGGRRP